MANLTRNFRGQTLPFNRRVEVLRLGSPGQRCATSTPTGAYLGEPQSTPLGFVKLILTVLPGLYVGAAISKTCAAFLEENDIFVPDDDDDDD